MLIILKKNSEEEAKLQLTDQLDHLDDSNDEVWDTDPSSADEPPHSFLQPRK